MGNYNSSNDIVERWNTISVKEGTPLTQVDDFWGSVIPLIKQLEIKRTKMRKGQPYETIRKLILNYASYFRIAYEILSIVQICGWIEADRFNDYFFNNDGADRTGVKTIATIILYNYCLQTLNFLIKFSNDKDASSKESLESITPLADFSNILSDDNRLDIDTVAAAKITPVLKTLSLIYLEKLETIIDNSTFNNPETLKTISPSDIVSVSTNIERQINFIYRLKRSKKDYEEFKETLGKEPKISKSLGLIIEVIIEKDKKELVTVLRKLINNQKLNDDQELNDDH
jgi:hypothetical protein